MLTVDEDWNAPVEFHVVVDLAADPPSVAVWGELDLASVSAFRDAMNQVIEAGAQQLVVDLTHVTFLGSTGIRELIRARHDIAHVEVRAATTIVRRALASASLDDSIVITE